MVGRSGSILERWLAVTASARSLPIRLRDRQGSAWWSWAIFIRRIVDFGFVRDYIDGIGIPCVVCSITPLLANPRRLSADHDPLFRVHRWLANLRVLELEDIKAIPCVRCRIRSSNG
jgi:hypothetical protein